MKFKPILKTLAALLLVGGGVVLLSLASSPEAHESNSGGNSIALSAPLFVREASAAAADVDNGTSYLDDEAGISAYTHISGTIDLSLVRDVFRTIERETDQYITGSVGIADYTENYDPHVYVHTDGWVVAYYLAPDPASMVIDLLHYDGAQFASNMLEDAMAQILEAVFVFTFEANYYDFRYPNATNLMLIAEAIDFEGDDSFELDLPSDFTYYERTWSHALNDTNTGGTYSSSSTLYVNDVSINSLTVSAAELGDEWALAYGTLTPTTPPPLPPGDLHTQRISLDIGYWSEGTKAFGGFALVYQEVP